MPNPRLPSSHYSNIPYHEQSTPTPIYTSSVKARSSSVDFGSFSTPVFDYGAADLAPVNSRHHAGNRNLPSMSIDALTTPSSAPASIDSSKSPYAPLSTEYLTLPAIREIGDAPVLAPIRSESSSIPDTPKFPSIRLNLRPMSSLDAPIGSSDGRFVTAASQHDPASTNISSNNPHSGSAQISKENTKTNTKSAASISHILGPKSPVFNSSASTPMAGASLKTTPAEDNVVVVVSTKLSGERILKSPSPARKPKLSRGPSPTSDLGISDEARTKDRNTELPSTNTRVVDEVSYMKPDAPESAGLIPQEISATPLLSSDEPTVVVPINLAPKENNQMDLDDRI